MLWKKIQHHQLISSFVAFLFFSFLFSVGLSQDSYATKFSCHFVATGLSTQSINLTNNDINSSCPDFSTYSSSHDGSLIYSRFVNSSFTGYSSNPTLTSFWTRFQMSSNNTYSNGQQRFTFIYFKLVNPSSYSTVSGFNSPIFTYSKYNYQDSALWVSFPAHYIYSQNSNFKFTDYDFTLELTDDLCDFISCNSGGGSSEPEEPDCPEPETPYGDKLDDIKKAIYVCGAILIMLYFFFCIYKIIVKDGGSR